MAVNNITFSSSTPLPENLYVDANIIIAFLYDNHDAHAQASEFITKAIADNKQLYLSALTLDEIWHILMSIHYKDEIGKRFDPKNPGHIVLFANYIEKITHNLLSLTNFDVLGDVCGVDLVKKAIQVMGICNLSSRDSFHLANLICHSIDSFVTSDGDFDGLIYDDSNFSIIKV